MKIILIRFSIILGLLAATQVFAEDIKRDFSTVMQGAKIFKENCSVCHGHHGQGNPGWRTRGSDGKLLPPPLNGSGHAWHHTLPILRQRVLYGGIPTGGSMPPFRDKLKLPEIDAILAWLQSRWPEDIFKKWEKANRFEKRK